MATQAFLGIGNVELEYEDPDVAFSWLPVAEVLSISGPTLERAEVDVTNMDSAQGFREFIAGLGDAGEVTFGVNYNPDNVSHDETANGLIGMLLSGATTRWRIQFPNVLAPKEWVFPGYVSAAPLELPVDAQAQMNVTVRVTGVPTIQALGTSDT